jgi:hypothetical protein
MSGDLSQDDLWLSVEVSGDGSSKVRVWAGDTYLLSEVIEVFNLAVEWHQREEDAAGPDATFDDSKATDDALSALYRAVHTMIYDVSRAAER